jgi:AcrR family transcriptional regulator
MRARRDRILDAAVELFRDRGFHAAGIDDIGQAAGITGPGVYRHFASKQDLLLALFEQIADSRDRAARAILATTDDAGDALAALVEDHVRFALADRALIAVYLQELRSLPAREGRRIRHRQRRYLDAWTGLVRRLRPTLTGDEALATVHAAINVIHSVAFYESRLPQDRLRTLLRQAALAVLHGK